MDKFGIIGWPVAHSKSPKLFNAAYNGEFQYDLIGAPTFEECWRMFLEGGYRAINVTAPYKVDAFLKADIQGESAARVGAANIIVRTPEGLVAHNSDFLGVKRLISDLDGIHSACIVGFGGAGKAAMAAAQDCGLDTALVRHDGLSSGIDADLVIYTLPGMVDGADKIQCKYLLEANYKDPGMMNFNTIFEHYIPGTQWLLAQAVEGYGLMTGKNPDKKEIFRALGI